MDEQVIVSQRNNLVDIIQNIQLHRVQYCAEVDCEVVHQQYGVGGLCLHRGYYCPSIIADIIVGNVSRGKLLKKLPTNVRPDYIYGFDTEGCLRVAKQADRCEYIIFQDHTEIGVVISNRGDIEAISECRYDERKLVSYAWGLYDARKKDPL